MNESKLSDNDARITHIFIAEQEPSKAFGFDVNTEEEKTFFHLCNAVYQCGLAARSNQSLIHRALKADGSILTETDLAVSKALLSKISELYPGCNIITEETENTSFDNNAPYTFILDPIDGTDSYSQGLATWCISLGILDKDRKIAGGIVFAPRFGVGKEELFLCTMPSSDIVYHNAKPICAPLHNEKPKQITMGSNVFKYTDFGTYKGKIRSFGSSILHMISPLVFSNIDACYDPLCYVWDFAGAHALVSKTGFVVRYMDKSELIYNDELLLDRKQIKLPLLVGNESCVSYIEDTFTVDLKEMHY